MQVPFWQVPPVHAVPAGFGLHLPFLHRLQGPHFFLHVASAWLSPKRARGPPRASPPRSRVNLRRVVLLGWVLLRERVKVVNASVSICFTLSVGWRHVVARPRVPAAPSDHPLGGSMCR